MSVVLGGMECADAFRLISALSFYVCCFGGKGMRRCIPFDFCSVFLCLLFWGEGNAQMHSVDLCLLFGGRECADAFHLISVLSFYVGFEDNFFSVFLCLLGHSMSIQQIYASHSTTSDFDKNFHRMFTNVLEHAVQNFAAILSVFLFWRNFKDVVGDPNFRNLQIAF